MLTGCQRMDRAQYISDTLGVDFSAGTASVEQTGYGGFLGDGLMAVTVTLTREQTERIGQQLDTQPGWHPFPLSENMETALYGKAEPDRRRLPLFDVPQITNGWYYFRDRHQQARDPLDDSSLFSRSSINCTVAVFDADTGKLYYFEYDT